MIYRCPFCGTGFGMDTEDVYSLHLKIVHGVVTLGPGEYTDVTIWNQNQPTRTDGLQDQGQGEVVGRVIAFPTEASPGSSETPAPDPEPAATEEGPAVLDQESGK